MTTKDRPILFSAPMVRALLDGSKTQTRRVVKRSDEWPASAVKAVMLESRGTALAVAADRCTYGPEVKSPYGQPGDRLWVREKWRGIVNIAPPGSYKYAVAHYIPDQEHCRRVEYAATQQADTDPWRSSIHMPRWASRITLDITGVRVERLQDISEADLIQEGSPHRPCAYQNPVWTPRRLGYCNLWEQINGPDSWAANPWVWVIEFKKASQ